MLKSKRGSLIVESSIIVPIIIILVVIFVLILIFSFQYNLVLMKTHHKSMQSEFLESTAFEFEINKKIYHLKYDYKPNTLSAEKFQQTLDFFLYTLDYYYEGFLNE